MTNNYENFIDQINRTIIENNNTITELQRTNLALLNMVTFMSAAIEAASESDIHRYENHELVKFVFKFGNNTVTKLLYEVDELNVKKVPNIIMSYLNKGGGVIDIDNIGSIEIDYFEWDGKGAIIINHDTEDLVKAYNNFMYIAKM